MTQTDNQKQVMLSAMQPSNFPTLGNYLGAVRHWTKLVDKYDCYFFGVDLHAITVPQDPKVLLENTYKIFAFYLAAGLNQDNCTLFMQSHVPEHIELAWILTCSTWMGELSRMTQFKDKSAKSEGKNIGTGLFTYPVLMAADIFLYDAELIPVGDDQKQHVELARNLAQRFNQKFGRDVFVVPEPIIPKVGARIMDLQNPTAKMSKSAQNPKGSIFLDDSDKDIQKKFNGAVTDSGSVISWDDSKPGIKNLLSIQSTITGKSIDALVDEYAGKMYGHLKVETAEIVIATVAPIRDEATRLYNNRDYLRSELQKGAEKAREKAAQKLKEVKDLVGFINL